MAPFAPSFWRPLMDNDYGAGMHNELAIWRNAGAEATLTGEVKVDEADTGVGVQLRVMGCHHLSLKHQAVRGELLVSAEWRPAPATANGGTAYLLAKHPSDRALDRHVDVEPWSQGKVSARKKDQGDWQRLTLVGKGKAPGTSLEHGDVVAIVAVTGKTEAALLTHSVVATEQAVEGLPGVRVAASGAPAEEPLWTIAKKEGAGEVLPGDEVGFR